ncbi:hypothetical protein ACFRAQ_36125 [Nocardia sp. NPDC056611]|uniref:hypothetical protein n=1 Tax=Nocardia sp. NPDC056611 TaxID=3345877 RepID=UPI003670E101
MTTQNLDFGRFSLTALCDMIWRPESFAQLTGAQLAAINAEIHHRRVSGQS